MTVEFARSPELDRPWTQPLMMMLFNGAALMLLGGLDVLVTVMWMVYFLIAAMDAPDPEPLIMMAVLLAGYRGLRTLGSFGVGMLTMVGARKLRDEGPHLLGYTGLVAVTVWPIVHLALSFLSCSCMEMFLPIPFLLIGMITSGMVMSDLPQLSERSL